MGKAEVCCEVADESKMADPSLIKDSARADESQKYGHAKLKKASYPIVK